MCPGQLDAARVITTPLEASPEPAPPLALLFDEAASRAPDAPFLSSRTRPQEDCTYGAFATEAHAVARSLVAAGVQPGDRVALICENRPRWCVAWAAGVLAGAVMVTLETQLTPEGIAAVLDDAQASWAFTSAELAHLLHACLEAGTLRAAFLLDEESVLPGASAWSKLAAGAPASLPTPVGGDAQLALLYTSGTTGDPKGVALTHANLQAERVAIERAVALTSEDVLLMFLPMHHVLSQIGAFLMPAAMGARVVHVEVQSAEDLLLALREEEVTILLAVPLLYHRIHAAIASRIDSLGAFSRALTRALMKASGRLRRSTGINPGRALFRKVHARFGGRLRLCVSGASHLDPGAQEELYQLGFTVVQAYGLTECTGAATFTPPERTRVGTVGMPLAGVSIRIDSPDAQGVGEVCIAGAILTPGYHQRPDASASLLREGWLHSGDLGRLMDDDTLVITGRMKEVIILENGKNVYPEDLEAHYARAGSIDELCVLEKDGRLHAVIVPDWGAINREGASSVGEKVRADILGYAAELPAWQRVLSFELRRDALPRTATRKLQRFRVQSAQDGGPADSPPPEDSPDVARRLASSLGQALAAHLRQRIDEGAQLSGGSHLELDLGLDSMRRMELFVSLEQALGVRLGEERAASIGTVDELLIALEELGAQEQSSASDAAQLASTGLGALVAASEPSHLPSWMQHRRSPLSTAALGAMSVVVRALAGLAWRFRVHGQQHLPEQAPFLVCPNHQSYADAFLVGAALPLRHSRDAFALGHARYVGQGLSGVLARFVNTVPTDPDRNLRSSMQFGAAGLKAGRPLVIFPEGSRSPDGRLLEIRMGAPVLARELDLPIVPARIQGAFEAWPRNKWLPRPGRVKLTFGPPIVPSTLLTPGGEPGHDYALLTQALEEAYCALGVPGARARAPAVTL